MFPRAVFLLILTAAPLPAEILFADNFDHSGALHGAAPDTRPGSETWIASGQFAAAGSVTATPTLGGSATLAFTPVNGRTYTLDARFSATAAGTSNEWLALGFASGQSNVASTNDRFINANVIGKAWMLLRGSATPASPNNGTLLGNGTTGGTASSTNWVTWTGGTGGTIDLRVVLDTTGGPGTWTATWYAKRPADPAYSTVRPTATLLDETINSVGFAKSNTAVTGTLLSFSLSATGDGPPPPPPADDAWVSLIPVTDGNPATDENGYAGSAINSIAFAQNNLITIGDQQIIAYYRRHASDAAHPANNTVVIGRRATGESQWELFPTNFLSFNIDDTHNVISGAIDGDGYLHMSWGMHVHALLYAKSTAPVTGTAPIVMTSLGTAGMTGQEAGVTYPKFQTLPDGDVLFLFREGGSGSGDWFLNRYDTATDTWAPVHANASGIQQPLMLGRGHVPDNCFYPDRLTLGPDGMLHLAGVFRYNSDSPAGQSGYQTNHRYVYLRSPDGGTSWQRSDGSPISVPVVENAAFQNLGPNHVPEIVKDLAEGHSIMNESGMTTDSAGRPIIANWWADQAASGNHTRQYHIFFHNGSAWQQRTVSARAVDNPATKFSEAQLGASWVGRPVVLTDAQDRIIVLYNDNRFDGITAVFSLPLAQDPGRNHWTRMNLTSENLGRWEVTYDEERWKSDGVLQMLYQKLPGTGASYTSRNNSTPVAVLEWDARSHFDAPVQWIVDTRTTPGQAKVSARTRTGFRHDLRTSTGLDFSAPPAATATGDGTWQDFGTWPTNEARRFWRIESTEQAADNP
jgi:hypothetical protein